MSANELQMTEVFDRICHLSERLEQERDGREALATRALWISDAHGEDEVVSSVAA